MAFSEHGIAELEALGRAVETEQTFDLVITENGIVELRAFRKGTGTIQHGYFDDRAAFTQAAQELSSGGYNVYVTLNPPRRDLLETAPNRITSGGATRDADISSRRYLMVDVDPERSKDVGPDAPASAEECIRARQCATEIVEYLKSLGWPNPAILDSGNGTQLWFRVNLAADESSKRLVQKVLRSLSALFSSDQVTIDTSVSNASRLARVAGTTNRKGTEGPQRPFRECTWEEVPADLELVELAQLEGVARMIPDRAPVSPSNSRIGDARAYLHEHGLAIRSEKTVGGGSLFELEQCPWNPEHAGTAFVIQFGNGGFHAGCHHHSCSAYRWKDLRNLLEAGNLGSDGTGAGRRQCPAFVLHPLSDFTPEDPDYLYEGYIPLGELTTVEGDPGVGKSTFIMNVAARVTRGTLPGACMGAARNVLLFAAEDSPSRVAAKRAASCGANTAYIQICSDAFDVTQQLTALDGALTRFRPALVVFDPLTSYLPGRTDINRANEVRQVTSRIQELARTHNCAIVLVRHLGKGENRPALQAAIGSVDFAAVARSMLLVAEDPSDRARRIMAHTKHNLGPKGASLVFRLLNGGIEWLDEECNLTADDLLNGGRMAPKVTTEERHETAVAWVRGILWGRTLSTKEFELAAKEACISQRSITKARRSLGVEAKPKGAKGKRGAEGFHLSLPSVSVEQQPPVGVQSDAEDDEAA